MQSTPDSHRPNAINYSSYEKTNEFPNDISQIEGKDTFYNKKKVNDYSDLRRTNTPEDDTMM